MAAARAIITPKLMQWARETAHLRPDEAAKKIGVSEESIRAWEAGEHKPTLLQARNAAETYGRPLAVFYLDEVPPDFAVIRDFRRLVGTPRKYSYALTLLIRELQARQEWANEILKELHEPTLRFVGSASVRDDPIKVAVNIRSTLKISLEEQASWGSFNTALNAWVSHAEGIRVFVSQTSVHGEIEVEDARGFALSNKYAPYVFLNPKDSLGGRIFTLAHELAHLWVGASGVSGPELSATPNTEEGDIELFCNRVAANVVLPQKAVGQIIDDVPRTRDITLVIDENSRRFCVSRDVIARRLAEETIISWETYTQLHEQYVREWHEERNRASSGGNYYVNQVRAIGKSLVQLVGDVYSRGRITGAEAAGLLNVKLDNLNKLMQRAHSGGRD